MDHEFDGLGGSLLAAEDALESVLQEVHAAGLRQLKAAGVAWCNHARRELCNRLWVRLSRREGQPAPAGVDSITDLDVECLNEAGRPWEVVLAGRQLPQLARLHGYGFVVDVQAVREADLGAKDEEENSDEEDDDDAPRGGDILRSCIQGEGDPPHKLLLAAVACAASGTVCEVPVQWLREDDAIDDLDLGSLDLDSGIGDNGATLLALMLPAATSLRSLNLLNNALGSEGGAALAEGLKGNTTLQSLHLACNQLCGLDHEGRGTYTTEGITKLLCEVLKGSGVTSLNLSENRLGSEAGAALAEGLKGNTTMQSLNLELNQLGPEGGTAIAEGLKGNSTLQSLNLGGNQLCGVKGHHGTYTTEGITKLCEALRGSVVTSLSLAFNQLCGVDFYGKGTYTTEGITKLCEGLKGSAVTSLNLKNNHLGTKGAAVLAEFLRGNSTLQSLGLMYNGLTDEAEQALKDAAGSSVRIEF